LAQAIKGQALTIDYRLAPEHPYPAALDDCLRAYKWLRTQAKGDIIVSGEDAGGGLAIALVFKLREANIALPKALYLLSPFADLSLRAASIQAHGAAEPMMTRDFIKNLAASYIGSNDFKSPFISPVFADLSGFPPMLIHAAANEALADDAIALAAAAKRAGVPVTLNLFEDSVHAFALFDFLPETQVALDQFAAFAN
jgi:salicylate hydroxylase